MFPVHWSGDLKPRNTLVLRNIRLNLNNVQEDVVMTFVISIDAISPKIDRELRAEISRRWPTCFNPKLKRLKLAIRIGWRATRTLLGRRLRLKKT
jgi:hypothetical protein